MFTIPKNARFTATGEVAKALGLTKSFVSRVVHGKDKSNRVAKHIFRAYGIKLSGYSYGDKK